MKYFIDFEFIEGFHKPLFGKRRHFIDMISVGIVCEDGREYYAISKNFNPKDADKWVKENVIAKLPFRNVGQHDSPRLKGEAMLWKYNNMITFEILNFFECDYFASEKDNTWTAPEGIEVYGYYADYDWVLLCSLFGRMIDLPENFPMYCKDLKQMLDEKTMAFPKNEFFEYFHREDEPSLDEKLKVIKRRNDYPQQDNEHNALADAKWNKDLYNFLQTL